MDGVLALAKPAGPTSHDMVALVRRLTGTRRVGHGGTLDPFASGVLPIFLGAATRMLEYHLGDTKEYRATVCFGAASATDDLEGELTPAEGPAPTREQLEGALGAFRGTISQVPPAYSAVKVAGRRAYALARAGLAAELHPRDVMISRLEVDAWDDSDPNRPISILDVECSAGTYVRALARDLGQAVGSAAYLGALVRTRSGQFTLEAAHPVDDVRRAAAGGHSALADLLLPSDWGLDRLPAVVLDPDQVGAVARGQFVRPTPGSLPETEPDTPIRLLDPSGRLVGIALLRDGRLAPDKVLIGGAATSDLPREPVEAALRAERDPEPDVDADPASVDDA
jgi:tRNA pseudouridine55 synthase